MCTNIITVRIREFAKLVRISFGIIGRMLFMKHELGIIKTEQPDPKHTIV